MDIELKGRKVIICGSTQGIGRATANVIAGLGAEVILFSRNEEKLAETVGELSSKEGQSHSYLVADFSHPIEVNEAIVGFLESSGGAHILVNNSGGPPAGKAIDADPEEFRVAFNQHLISNQIITKALVPYMIRENYGRIVNIISTSVKEPIAGIGVSNTIRGAVASWSKTIAAELGQYGITVNNVLPGATLTGRLEAIFEARSIKTSREIEDVREEARKEIPLHRFAQAEEIANAIAFLASPAAAYISGINLPVDGGRMGCL
jgi:3-oxoacyl-[acyl-carrier protein] reductase